MKVKEQEIKIKTPDRKYIYGALTTAGKKSDTLVIFVHGFTGHQNEHVFFNGAKFFTEKGFNTYRFNLYGGEGRGARHFHDTNISLHGEDITTAVTHFKKTHKKIFVIGHSYGGTALLFVDQSIVDGFVFWDASYISAKDHTEHLTHNKKLDAYILDWGIEIIVGKKFVEELTHFPDCGELIKKIHKPVLLIGAGMGNIKASKKYYEKAATPKKLIIIQNADHNFNTFKSEMTLLRETYEWLKRL